MQTKIMYVCEFCADHYPEGCGHYDRNELRVLPDGRWLCLSCFVEEPAKWDEYDQLVSPEWADLPSPPEYKPETEAVTDA